MKKWIVLFCGMHSLMHAMQESAPVITMYHKGQIEAQIETKDKSAIKVFSAVYTLKDGRIAYLGKEQLFRTCWGSTAGREFTLSVDDSMKAQLNDMIKEFKENELPAILETQVHNK